MKKIFSFLSALVCAMSLSAQTYYITGNEAALFAKSWEPAGMALEQQTDGTWSKSFTTCEIGKEYQFKITDGSWENTWGYSELTTVPEGVTTITEGDGKNNIVCKTYDANMTVVFDPTTKKITLTGVFVSGDEGGEGGSTDPSVTEYWYFDENNTGWGTIDDKWKMTVSGDIAYVKVPAGQANKFKIFPCNPKEDKKVLANDDNIAEGALAGDIALSKDTEEWKNILIGETSSEYFVVLYLPNTATNSSSKYLVAAKSQLHTGISNAEVQTNFTKIIRNGQVLIVRDGKTFDMMGQQVL